VVGMQAEHRMYELCPGAGGKSLLVFLLDGTESTLVRYYRDSKYFPYFKSFYYDFRTTTIIINF